MAPKFEFRLSIRGPEFAQEVVVLPGETIIGRDPSAGIQLLFPLISRRHAKLICTDAECTILDLESANGTLVNKEKLIPNEPVKLTEQSIIEIGPFEMRCEVVPVQAPVEEEIPVVAVKPVEEKPAEVEVVEVKPAEEKPEPAPKPTAARAPKKAAKPAGEEGAGPPPPPSKPAVPELIEPEPPEEQVIPPGLSIHSRRLLNFLPGIYHSDFMSRFLALFESILTPVEWNIDNFDLYLSPGTSPMGFLPWLANWYQVIFDSTWSEEQRRKLLWDAHQIYARRGTRWALGRILEIYTGQLPEIREFTDEKQPFLFVVKFPFTSKQFDSNLIEQIIDANKPAHTTYRLEFQS